MSDPGSDPTRVDQPVVPGGDPTQVAVPVVPADDGGVPPGGWEPPGGSVPPPPNRRPWVIAALLAVIVLVLVLILLLQDDDEGDDASTVGTSTTTSSVTSSSTSTTAPGTTTSSAAPSTTEAPGVTVPPEECAENGEGAAQPGPAAETVYDAWVRGDEACAAELMTPAALAELFATDGEGADQDFQGCTEEEQPDPHADCAFTYEGGATHYLMSFSPTDGWQVFDIQQVAD